MRQAVTQNGVMGLRDVMAQRITHLDDRSIILMALVNNALHVFARVTLSPLPKRIILVVISHFAKTTAFTKTDLFWGFFHSPKGVIFAR